MFMPPSAVSCRAGLHGHRAGVAPRKATENRGTWGQVRYFPKGTGLGAHRASGLQAVAPASNTRPRETLGRRAPAETFDELLHPAGGSGVATSR